MSLHSEIVLLKTILRSEDLVCREECLDRLRKIEERSKDGTLRVAVIGEFNAGKSTFINALLRRRVLQEGALPTTAAATHLKSGSEKIFIRFVDGTTVESVSGASRYLKKRCGIRAEGLLSVVSFLTAKQSVARLVKSLHVCIPKGTQPSAIMGGLPDNVELIDTPGFNPGANEVDNHFDVTRDVVENYADLAIVLTPAHAAMSSTLLSFLENHLRDYVHRCLFVITKVDDHNETELRQVCQMVGQVLQDKFGLKLPNIYTVAARTMLPVKYMPPELEESWNFHQSCFREFEKLLWRLLAESRDNAIRATLARCLKPVSSEISAAIEEKSKHVRSLQYLAASGMLKKVETLTEQILSSGCNKIQKKCVILKGSLLREIKDTESRTKGECASIIRSGGYLKEFESKERVRISNLIKQRVDCLQKDLAKKINDITKASQRIARDFEEKFSEHYKDMQALVPELSHCQSAVKINAVFSGNSTKLTLSQYELQDGETAVALGAGVVMGQMLIPIPVVGAVIGAAVAPYVAGVLKQFFGPPAEEIQKKAIKNINTEIEKVFDSVASSFLDTLKQEMENKQAYLNSIAEAHIREYGATVEKLRASSRRQIDQYNEIINRLSNYQNHLNTIKQKLNEFIKL